MIKTNVSYANTFFLEKNFLMESGSIFIGTATFLYNFDVISLIYEYHTCKNSTLHTLK